MTRDEEEVRASCRRAGIPDSFRTLQYSDVLPPLGQEVHEWIFSNWDAISAGRGAAVQGPIADKLFLLMANTMHISGRGVWITHPVGLAQAIRNDAFPETGFKSLFIRRFVDNEMENPLTGWTKELVEDFIRGYLYSDVSVYFRFVNGTPSGWWTAELCDAIEENTQIFGG